MSIEDLHDIILKIPNRIIQDGITYITDGGIGFFCFTNNPIPKGTVRFIGYKRCISSRSEKGEKYSSDDFLTRVFLGFSYLTEWKRI